MYKGSLTRATAPNQPTRKNMFKRLMALIRGFFGLFISGIEKDNPEALLENEKENLRKQISQFNTGLANHAGLVEKLMSQVKTLQAREKDLKAKTHAFIKAGNRELAAKYAAEFKAIDGQEDQLRVQLEEAETRYKELVRARDVAVKAAKDKIDEITRGMNSMKVEKAMAEMNEMAAGMVGNLGGSGDTLNRLSEMVEEERTKAAGRARVAKDSVDLSEIQLKEGEQAAMADLALAEFAAAEGIDLPGPIIPKDEAAASAPASEGSLMGPVSA